MHLVEVFLPLADNDGKPFGREIFAAVEKELADTFGGVTAYPRAPASGLWKQGDQATQRDELIIYEVMTERIDASWWQTYRKELERRFDQDQILVRTHEVDQL